MALSLGLSPGARGLSRRMGRSWAAFARDGHPGEDWPRHTPGDPGVFVFGGTTGWSRRADVPALRYQAEVASRTAMGE
jgi:carboxylesterase type B